MCETRAENVNSVTRQSGMASDGDHALRPVGRQSGAHLDNGFAVNSVLCSSVKRTMEPQCGEVSSLG